MQISSNTSISKDWISEMGRGVLFKHITCLLREVAESLHLFPAGKRPVS